MNAANSIQLPGPSLVLLACSVLIAFGNAQAGTIAYQYFTNEGAFVAAVCGNPCTQALGEETFSEFDSLHSVASLLNGAGPVSSQVYVVNAAYAPNYWNGTTYGIGEPPNMSGTAVLTFGSAVIGAGPLCTAGPPCETYLGFDYAPRYPPNGAGALGVDIAVSGAGDITQVGGSPLAQSGFFGVIATSTTSQSATLTATVNDSSLVYVDNVLYPGGPGSSQSNPESPDSTVSAGSPIPNGGGAVCSQSAVVCYGFQIGPAITVSGGDTIWIDPAAANEFVYQTLDGSFFTSIAGFPAGFTSPFDVSSGGIDYGSFEPGQTMTFQVGGVSSFTISGINPLVDGSNPSAFPLEVSLNQIGAEVAVSAFDNTGTSTPEPASGVMLVAGLSAAAYWVRKWVFTAGRS
jgi:hypothetical protein